MPFLDPLFQTKSNIENSVAFLFALVLQIHEVIQVTKEYLLVFCLG